jgi:hypothetical protein
MQYLFFFYFDYDIIIIQGVDIMHMKNGFIATSIIYSFFTVFILIALTTLGMYTHYRTLLYNLNNSVLSDLNDKIEAKYSKITNLVENSGFEDGHDMPWILNPYSEAITCKSNPTYKDIWVANDDCSLKLQYTKDTSGNTYNHPYSAQIMQLKNIIPADNNIHHFYVRFVRFINTPRVNATSGDVWLSFNGNNYYFSSIYNTNVLLNDNANDGKFTNSEMASAIFDIPMTSNQDMQLIFEIKDMNVITDKVYLDNIMVVDVSNYYSAFTSDAEIKAQLDSKLLYFTGSKYITLS